MGCINNNCKSKMYTNNTQDEIIKNNLVLIRKGIDAILNRQEGNNLLKRKGSEDNIEEKPSKLILTEIKHFNTENNLNTTNLNHTRRNMYNKRKSILPALLKTINEVHDTIQWIKNKPLVLSNHQATHIIIFSCIDNLKFLCSN